MTPTAKFCSVHLGRLDARCSHSRASAVSSILDASRRRRSAISALIPVEKARQDKSWEYGPFVNAGTGVGESRRFQVLSGGFQLGKPLTPVVHAGFFVASSSLAATSCRCGRRTHQLRMSRNTSARGPNGQPEACLLPVGGGTFRGVSLTPVILRWNFLTRSRSDSALVPGRRRTDLYHAQVSAEPAECQRNRRRNPRVELFASGRSRGPLLHASQTVDRSRSERGAHFLGLAGRSQSRRKCQYSGAGRLHVLEIEGSRRITSMVCARWKEEDERRGSRVRSELLRGQGRPACRSDCGRDAR